MKDMLKNVFEAYTGFKTYMINFKYNAHLFLCK